jgi:hypothetical protein
VSISRRSAAHLLTRDHARRIAVSVATLSELLKLLQAISPVLSFLVDLHTRGIKAGKRWRAIAIFQADRTLSGGAVDIQNSSYTPKH